MRFSPLLIVPLLAGPVLSVGQPPPPNRPPPGGFRPPPGRSQEVRVEFIKSNYRAAPGLSGGFFRTGQDADLMLSGIDFNHTGGPLLFNHPSGLASDGKCLLVCDRNNNRVLIWRTAPASNTPPDLVLGQPDFTSNNPGGGRHQLNWPSNVAITPDGGLVAVADTQNDRILVWKSLPSESGAAADVVLELGRLGTAPPAFDAGDRPRPGGGMRLGWPWGVWTDGNRLAAVATHGRSVLIWNVMPTRDNQRPDLVLTPPGAGTLRNITSDGRFFALSDHNYGEESRPATMVWRTFPTRAAQPPDFVWREWLKGAITADGQVVLAGSARIFCWQTPPPDSETSADVVLQPAGYRNGDGPDIAIAGGRMYACNYNGNNVLVWDRIPSRHQEPPAFAVGSDRPEQDTLKENYFITNPVVATNGKSLFVSSDFDRRLLVWRNLPDESGARPDLVYSLPEGPWDNALNGQTLVLAGQRTVYVWKQLPLDGQKPDLTYAGGIGSIRFRALTGVALDDRYLYLADRDADCIYGWKGLPARDEEPAFTMEVHRPGRLSSDGTYFAVAPFEGAHVWVERVAELPRRWSPVRLGGPGRFNLPGKCVAAGGQLFLADTSNHRVHAWNQVEDALAGRPADAILGQHDETGRHPAIGRNRLFMPGTVALGGGYLWVGEFKFSGRLLRFSPHRLGKSASGS